MMEKKEDDEVDGGFKCYQALSNGRSGSSYGGFRKDFNQFAKFL